MTLVKKLLAISVATASLAIAINPEAQAATINQGEWNYFEFGSVGVPADNSPWEFSVGQGGAFLTIQDAFLGGDIFSAYNNGNLLGTTSTVPATSSCGNDLLACASNPLMSKGKFFLSAGDYSMTIIPDASPHGSGGAYFRVDVASVPEPTTILGTLVFSSLGAGSWLKRRKKTA
jgi:hypothetical protein